MRVFILLILSAFLFSFSQSGSAQVSQKQLKNTADGFYKIGNYRQALNYYMRYHEYDSYDMHVAKRMAISQYKNNLVDKAQESFEKIISDEKVADDYEALYYYAEILMHQQEFYEAATYFKKALAEAGDSEQRSRCLRQLRHCESAFDIVHLPKVGFIENLGPMVNSIEDDITPLFSRNHVDRIYFASNFDRDEANPLNATKSFDIYSTELKDGNWLNPTLFPKKFSSARDEFPLDFFMGGQVMYFQRGSVGGASILIDTFSIEQDTNVSSEFSATDAPIFPELGDEDIHSYNDSIIIFSSVRPEGFGGLDLYYTIKTSTGWRAPKNMGDRINTKYDEADPFLTNNGATIYFSSNRPESMGGYDIFYSRFNATIRDWGRTRNMGLPVSSVDDDRDLQIAENGRSIIFSSNRTSGYGGFDLYVVYPEEVLGDMTISRGEVQPAFLVVQQQKSNATIAADTIRTPISVNIPVDVVTDNPTPVLKQAPALDPNVYPLTNVDVAPIYYSASDVVLNPQSTKALDKIADLLIKYPRLSINIISHSAAYDGPKHFDLYFSARRAEQVVNYLIERGAKNANLTIMGVGDQYPYAKRVINGEVAGFSTKLNRRIELVIDGGQYYNLRFAYVDGGLGQDYIDQKSNELSNLLQGVSFKAQVKRATQVYKDNVLEEHPHAMVEKSSEDRAYFYTVGWSTSVMEIQRLVNRLENDGYNQAEVIPYMNGHRLTEAQVDVLVESYPELGRYRKMR